jgi:transcriptional regulator of heat shock response
VNTRQSKLLAAIIDQFIQTGIPVGSKAIIEHEMFNLSGATIRNEMQILSEQGFIDQPHVSSGRVPTALGYRMYVQEFMEPTKDERIVRKKFDTLKNQYLKRKDQERVYEAVALLSHMSPNVAFATVPHRNRVFYMGLANVLKQPEFLSDATLASAVVEVLEDRLSNLLGKIDVDDKVRYYIGEDHILEQLQSCSMLVTGYNSMRGREGAIGILGPMRMDYAFNTVSLELSADLLRS